jgi:hypothetical protein
MKTKVTPKQRLKRKQRSLKARQRSNNESAFKIPDFEYLKLFFVDLSAIT